MGQGWPRFDRNPYESREGLRSFIISRFPGHGPVTLRTVVVDRMAMIDRLGECPSLELVWAFSLKVRDGQTVAQGRAWQGPG